MIDFNLVRQADRDFVYAVDGSPGWVRVTEWDDGDGYDVSIWSKDMQPLVFSLSDAEFNALSSLIRDMRATPRASVTDAERKALIAAVEALPRAEGAPKCEDFADDDV